MRNPRATIAKCIGAILLVFGVLAITNYLRLDTLTSEMLDAVDTRNLAEAKRLVSQKPDNVNAQFPMDRDITDAPGGSVLLRALRNRDKPMALFLIEHGADVKDSHHYSGPPLMSAAGWGDPDVIERMLQKGANPNCRSNEGESPLHIAVFRDHILAAKLLRRYGATSVPRIIEAAAFGEDDTMRQLLHSHPEQLNVVDRYCNWTLLETAINHRRLNIVRLLVARGARIDTVDSRGDTLLAEAAGYSSLDIVRFLVESGANVNQGPPELASPLAHAAGSGKVETVKFLISEGANVNARFQSGSTPILWVSGEDTGIAVAAVLLSRGADVNSADNDGTTLLHQAVSRHDENLIEFLVSKGARANVKDKNGKTPLRLAEEDHYVDAVNMLKRHSAATKK